MTTLPRALQSLIADAQRVRAQPETHDADDLDDEFSESLLAADKFVDELSRGEYSQELYWECVATDCEEEGDWERAKAAYQKVVDLVADSGFDRWKAYDDLARLHALLGEDGLALQDFHAASCALKGEPADVLYRFALLKEAWHLVAMERFSSALALARKGHSTKSRDSDDPMDDAALPTVIAACYLAQGRTNKARKFLRRAWQRLESLRAELEAVYGIEDATCVHSAYGTWWSVQAEYLRVQEDHGAELSALENSLAQARLVARHWDEACPYRSAAVMRLLLVIADALERSQRGDEASAYVAEADEIFHRRRLPSSARRSVSLLPSRSGSRKPRLWRWLFGE